MSNKPNHLTRLRTESHPVEGILFRVVREIDIFEFDITLNIFKRNCICFIRNTRGCIYDFKHAVGRSGSPDKTFVHLTERIDGSKELSHECLEHHEFAKT